MNKKKFLVNLLLLVILLLLVFSAIFFFRKKGDEKKENEKEAVVLKEIVYDSETSPLRFENADTIIEKFINGYNENDGVAVAQLMNLNGRYIYDECENKNDFDKKYEEKLSSDLPSDELMIMQYSMKEYEENLIKEINESTAKHTLIEYSDIENISKYLAKMTAKVRTVSENEEVDSIFTLEFILLNRDNYYSIIKYEPIEIDELE